MTLPPAAPTPGPAYDPFTPPPPPPTRRKPRTKLIAASWGAGGLVLGLILGSVGTQSDDTPAVTLPSAASTTASTTEDPATPSPSAVEPTTEPADDEPTPTPDPAAEGSRSAPFTIGETVGNEDWSVTLGEPTEAWKRVKAENQFNDPPADGFEFYLVPVTATYIGDESGFAWLDLRVKFVGADGVTYEDRCGVIPDDLDDVGELYEGGVAEGNTCVVVPEGAEGLWTLTAGWSDPVFFVAGS